MAVLFNRFCFALLSHSPPEGYPPTIFESARRVLLQLHSIDTRRPFSEENIWLLIKDPKKSLPKSLKDLFKKSMSSTNHDKDLMGMSFLDRIRDNDPTSIKILNLLPHTIPFETRLEIFRDYLKDGIPNILNTENMIKVRRAHVLDDGYKHLGGLTPMRTKGRIRVKFVNETGAEEDGVDQGGPFKEFITQLIAEAFDPSCGLFAVTPNSSLLYPNHQNTLTKITLYSFLGKMIARAIQEGILVDVQFAGFFLSKMAGRAVFLEDLIGLDDDLLKNLRILKRYDGNVEDLGLYFAIDEECNGKIVSKELRTGGSHMPVNNDNRIQAKEQTKAFINGFQSMIPENWLRMFSPLELQRVLSGEDVDWDISDLRKYTVYQNGYFDQHRSIRHFWSILEEMKSNDKSAFLKFVTSCSKPPLGGFKYLQPQFTIRMIPSDHDSSVENSNFSRSRLSMGQVKSLFSSIGNSKSASKERLPMSSTWKRGVKEFAYGQITQFPVYPALFSCEEIVKAVYPALFSCEEIVKAGNDGPV
ncbi:18338_t:CDS:10, partial [Funneliformis geosporum]